MPQRTPPRANPFEEGMPFPGNPSESVKLLKTQNSSLNTKIMYISLITKIMVYGA